tara:strand:- start:20965 stop:21690 length:726 start_codon:yes stop_codon:yes gene_type:complete
MGKNLSKITRNEDTGLITSPKIDYVFDNNGMIDWRKMLKSKHLYPNPSKNITETDVTKLRDGDLCILLGGIKELAQIRGYTNIEYDINTPSSDYVVATCKITWIPNYETEGKEVTFSAVGDASFENSSEVMGSYYLGPTAENRAFVRCVRSFLKINLVAKDELSGAVSAKTNHFKTPPEKTGDQSDPHFLLEKVMKEKGVSFDRVKEVLIKDGFDGAEDLQGLANIPKPKVFNLISRIKAI